MPVMTVAELKEELDKFPPELSIYVNDMDEDITLFIDKIRTGTLFDKKDPWLIFELRR